MTEADAPPKPPSADEVNRLWQHGMHEERLFHDRLNYFSFLETGLLTICGIMYNKEPAIGFFLPITVVGLLFTLLWIVIQKRHWTYCEHINSRIRVLVPEYKATLDGYVRPGRRDGFSLSKPLALAVPFLFACTWVAFLVWILVRNHVQTTTEGITVERIGLVVLAAALAWVMFKLRRLEQRLK
ncbi:hypothetical protein J8F10_11140 [Gemmata sp. G18]|uniref:DUF202 domain-containing protein n=1 Tax=Gemmata palustris TaxID=2822762 RepID=A0ABS5BQ28_9BACT|nr:hypothetical protein [Gemmata palustris]MBP3955839.1 hypothetical protein [Gemmata palustris]